MFIVLINKVQKAPGGAFRGYEARRRGGLGARTEGRGRAGESQEVGREGQILSWCKSIWSLVLR